MADDDGSPPAEERKDRGQPNQTGRAGAADRMFAQQTQFLAEAADWAKVTPEEAAEAKHQAAVEESRKEEAELLDVLALVCAWDHEDAPGEKGHMASRQEEVACQPSTLISLQGQAFALANSVDSANGMVRLTAREDAHWPGILTDRRPEPSGKLMAS